MRYLLPYILIIFFEIIFTIVGFNYLIAFLPLIVGGITLRAYWIIYFEILLLLFRNSCRNIIKQKILSREWLYTTNHKKLGLFYVSFAIVSALFGTALAALIRLELAQPGSFVFGNNGGSFHITVAVHAILMVFFVVTPIVFGGFGNYYLPLQVGARDVAYPRLNNFSVWLLPAGLLATLHALWDGTQVSQQNKVLNPQHNKRNWEFNPWSPKKPNLIENKLDSYGIQKFSLDSEFESFVSITGKATSEIDINAEAAALFLPASSPASNLTMTMAGWTFTTPFSHSRFTGRAVDMSIVGLIFSTITSIFTTINLVTTWRFLRGRGARNQRELFPIFLISLFISLRLLLLVSPILTAGFVMLLADRHFYTAFFTVRAGGDILLFQHIFWFFGHPEVYILVIPGFGYASTVIPYYVRKPISSKMHMVYAMHSIGCMSGVVWGHHMYLVGIDHKARTVFMTITIMIALPSTIKICGWLVSVTNGLTFITLDLWLAIIFVSIFFVGGMSGLMVAGAGLDILLHDTYYVVGHFHVMLSGAMILSIIGWIYFNFKEMFGTSYFWLFSGLHLYLHTVGHVVCFVPLLWAGYAGMPRRIQDYPYGYAGWHSVSSLGHTLVLTGIVNFFCLIAHALYYKRPQLPRIQGMPFVTNRFSFVVLDKYFAALTFIVIQPFGLRPIREYLVDRP